MRQNKIQAIKETRAWLKQKPLYLDTETTGLSNTDEIIDLALIDHDGQALIDTLIRPTVPISPGSEAIHRISNEMIINAPSFAEIVPNLISLTQGRLIIIYNADFDLRIIRQCVQIHRIKISPIESRTAYCAMKLYAQFYGEWNEYHGNYRWQRQEAAAHQLGLNVPADLHRAKADAALCRLIVEAMAATPLPEEESEEDDA